MTKKTNKKRKIMKGLTLIEMMMAIAIFVIGIEGFTLLFQRTWKTNEYTIELGQSTMSASRGLSKMVDYIRGARQGDDGSYPILRADDNELVLFCDYDKDGVTERLRFYKNNTDILMGVRRPTATLPKTYPTGDESAIIIVKHIMNDSSTPVFAYFNRDYPADTTNNPLATPSAVADLRLIKVYLEINTRPERAPDNVKMQSFVQMRNLSDYNQIQ
jgi:prepilin-type N-terminal cleavage/methylation domain-containing protein